MNGGRGRCYPFWLEFSRCIDAADQPIQCKDHRDDYIECLHHKKEVQRMVAVAEEATRQSIAPHNVAAADPAAVEPASAARK